MTLANPIDWSARYSALYAWASGVSGWTVRWADQPEARPSYPYIMLDVISHARDGGPDEVRREIDLTRARHVRLTPTAQNSATYTVTLNGTAYQFVSDSDATLAEICEGIATAVGLGGEPVTITDNATSVDIEGEGEALNPSTPQLFTLETSSNISWANLDAGNEVALTTCGQRIVTLNVQGFERNSRTDNAATDPSRNAFNMLSRLQSSLGAPSVQYDLRDASMAVIDEGVVLDLSEPVEDTILSRASMDVRLRTVVSLTEHIGYIERASGTATLTGTRDDPVIETFDTEA